jgi:hypothetical protein
MEIDFILYRYEILMREGEKKKIEERKNKSWLFYIKELHSTKSESEISTRTIVRSV